MAIQVLTYKSMPLQIANFQNAAVAFDMACSGMSCEIDCGDRLAREGGDDWVKSGSTVG